jgi:hypothetical protein
MSASSTSCQQQIQRERPNAYKESDYANAILLGMPLVQAYTAERTAPPFGVAVHESVRAFGQMGTRPVSVSLWRWWDKNSENVGIAGALLPNLRAYYEWCRKNPVASGYAPERIDAHWALAEEYLGEFENGSAPRASAISRKQAKSRETNTQEATQVKRDVEPHPDQQVAKLRKILSLSDTQVEQIKPIIEEREKQLTDLSKDDSIDNQVRRLRLTDILDESNVRIQLVLTEAQKGILIDRERAHSADHGGA